MTHGQPLAAEATAAARWYERPRAFLCAVIAVYLLARLFSGLVLFLVGLHQVDVVWFENERGYLRMTVLWDAFWYRQIVEDGYPPILPIDPDTGELWQNSWAFYPMFPYLTRYLMVLTGGGFALVGSTLSLLFGGVASVLVAILLRDKVGPRVALAGVTIWATMITSAMLQVAYTESIAMTLLCGVLLALTRRRWWWAAVIALLTGLARPIAIPLGMVALVTVYLRWRQRHDRPVAVGEYAGMAAALVSCGLSGLIWPLCVWLGTGVMTGYTETMTAWRAYDDIQPFAPWWYSAMAVTHTVAGSVIALLAVFVVVMGVAAGPWARALGPAMRAWALAYPFYLFAVLDPTSSIFRYLIPLFPWTVVMVGAGWGRPGDDPLASDLPPRRSGGAYATWHDRVPSGRGRRVWRLTLFWVVVGLLTQCWWIWEIWQFTPPSDNPP